MIKLLKYESLDKLNDALDDFEKQEIPIKKVKLLTEGLLNRPVYYVLIDNGNSYQKKD